MNKINNLYIRIIFALAVVLLIVMLWVRVNKNEHRIDTLYDVLDTDVSGISLEKRAWVRIQGWRSENNLDQYIYDQSLCDVANARLGEIKSDWSHKGFAKYIHNVDFRYLGENLAKGFDDSYQMFEAWLKSPTHRNNLIKYTHSCLVCSDGYCVQMFGIYR